MVTWPRAWVLHRNAHFSCHFESKLSVAMSAKGCVMQDQAENDESGCVWAIKHPSLVHRSCQEFSGGMRSYRKVWHPRATVFDLTWAIAGTRPVCYLFNAFSSLAKLENDAVITRRDHILQKVFLSSEFLWKLLGKLQCLAFPLNLSFFPILFFCSLFLPLSL